MSKSSGENFGCLIVVLVLIGYCLGGGCSGKNDELQSRIAHLEARIITLEKNDSVHRAEATRPIWEQEPVPVQITEQATEQRDSRMDEYKEQVDGLSRDISSLIDEMRAMMEDDLEMRQDAEEHLKSTPRWR